MKETPKYNNSFRSTTPEEFERYWKIQEELSKHPDNKLVIIRGRSTSAFVVYRDKTK